MALSEHHTTKLSARTLLTSVYVDKPYTVPDGGGLVLKVTRTSRTWRYRYRINGVAKTISLGKYPDVGLAKARKKHLKARKRVANGIDPVEHRRRKKEAKQVAAAQDQNTLAVVLTQWQDYKAGEWSDNYSRDVSLRLKWLPENLLQTPIVDITAHDLAAVLVEVQEKRSIDLAHKIKNYLRAALDRAVAKELIASNPATHPAATVDIKKRRKHTPMAHTTDVGVFADILKAIVHYAGDRSVQVAMHLLPRLFVRPEVLRGMRWSEIDLNTGIWAVPAERMKMNREHAVPLAGSVIELLKNQHDYTGHLDLVFPGVLSVRRPLSENTLNTALRRMGFAKEVTTSHGFRHTASTMLNQREFIVDGKATRFRPDVIEMQLAHVQGGVRGIYNQADYWDERVQMMTAWCAFCDGLAAAENVVSIQSNADSA